VSDWTPRVAGGPTRAVYVVATMPDATPVTLMPPIGVKDALRVLASDDNRLFRGSVSCDGELQILPDQSLRLITRAHRWDPTGTQMVGWREFGTVPLKSYYRQTLLPWLEVQTGLSKIRAALVKGEVELFRVPLWTDAGGRAIDATSPKRGLLSMRVNGSEWYFRTARDQETALGRPAHREVPMMTPHSPASALEYSRVTKQRAEDRWAHFELFTTYLMDPPWVNGSLWQPFKGTGSFRRD
jgi:hypothetical protein